MESNTIHVMIIITVGALVFAIARGIWKIYIKQFIHDCNIKVISRKTGYEYNAIKYKTYKEHLYLYIYNFYISQFEWVSVFQFENSEKIIKQLTDTQN